MAFRLSWSFSLPAPFCQAANMYFKKFLFPLVIGALGVVALMGMLRFGKNQPEILSQKYGGYDIEIFRNSDSLSQAFAINASGFIIGSREVEDASRVMLGSQSFFCGAKVCKDMPVPPEYSNVEAIAISDSNLVVGYASRTVGTEGGSLRAVVWDTQKDSIVFLPPAEGDESCHAQSISSDGSRIAGYSTGPQRLRPVIWNWDDADQSWKVVVLETVLDYNPYLMSSSLQISPDGSKAAGCCTEQILPGEIIDSSLYLWQEIDGKWERTYLSAEQMYVKDMNNRGEMVGSVLGQHGRLPCFVSSEGEVRLLKLLDGDTAGEARGINEKTEIVGWTDQPYSAEGGPRPCLWNSEGNVSMIVLSEIPFALVYDINESGGIAGMLTVSMGEQAEDSTGNADASTEVALAFRARPTR